MWDTSEVSLPSSKRWLAEIGAIEKKKVRRWGGLGEPL